MTFKTLLKTLLIALLFANCRTVKNIKQENTNSSTKEHIVKYTDTVFKTPKSKAQINLPRTVFIQKYDTVFKTKVIKQKQGNATAKIIIKHDTVILTAECDTIKIKAKIKKELKKETAIKENSKTEKTNKKKGISIQTTLLAIIAAFAIGYLIKKFKLF